MNSKAEPAFVINVYPPTYGRDAINLLCDYYKEAHRSLINADTAVAEIILHDCVRRIQLIINNESIKLDSYELTKLLRLHQVCVELLQQHCLQGFSPETEKL
ncbi:hypothetical protein ACKWNL_23850 [Escherichia coli]|uniref:hypothetical protein n=1 Tax=Escherichia coli TaxID=562 RepID=UPI000B719C3C|nr:hypothetical protein [Escherichia coli]OWC80645.1 hypothetical protein A8F88_20715 [Escherichia coli]